MPHIALAYSVHEQDTAAAVLSDCFVTFGATAEEAEAKMRIALVDDYGQDWNDYVVVVRPV